MRRISTSHGKVEIIQFRLSQGPDVLLVLIKVQKGDLIKA
jgi:hypothetical protein